MQPRDPPEPVEIGAVNDKVERRIAAILAADVVDYSRLMGVDEESTLTALKQRRSIFDRLVADCGGHEFGSVGDSLMAEFPSVVNAVRCAQIIQQRLAQENASLPPDRRMQLRIGINFGDVIEEGGSAFGDAVNIAARLQALAKPGGVLISGAVYDQVHRRIPARFIAAGVRHVKNVAEPVRTFEVLPAESPGFAGRLSGVLAHLATWRVRRVAWVVLAIAGAVLAYALFMRAWQAREAAGLDSSLAAIELPARSVAVLAFENRGGSEGTDILAEGIPETVLHQLALMRGLTVIARGSSFAFRDSEEDMRVIGRKLNVRYLLEGSVQTAGDRLRVTSSLIDAQTGASVWSRQFNPVRQDVFAVQDEIALEVARAMQLTLDAAGEAADGIRRSATTNYDAYFEFLRGRALLASVRVADVPAAIDALTAAIRHDPKFASAYVLLARARIVQAEQSPTGDLQETFPPAIEEAVGLLNEAIALNPGSGEAFVERGYLKLYFDVPAADADLRRGIELAPNYARGYEGLAAVMFQSVARRRDALEMLEKARRLDPLELRLDVVKATYLDFGNGDIPKASELLESVLERDPLFVPALVRLAGLRWVQGEFADSVALAEQAVKLDPGNDPAWRHLMGSYYALGEPAAAADAMSHTADLPASGQLWEHVYSKNWRKAGEAAYGLIAPGQTYFQYEVRVAIAIRRHARETGEYRRAIETLEDWADVSWEGDEPVLQGQLDMGYGVVALADMLLATDRQRRARVLLEEWLADSEFQISRYGRGEIWLDGSRAVAFALLGRPDEAMAMLKRVVEFGFQYHEWRLIYEDDPAFDTLRTRQDFLQLVEGFRAGDAREREQYLRMLAERRIPDRRSKN